MDHLLYAIREPLVCNACHAEFSAGQTDARSLRDYTVLDIGFTDMGLQVWCRRHERNVCHIDFEGRRPQADFRCLEPGPGADRTG